MYVRAKYRNPESGTESELILEGLGPNMILGAVADHLEGNVDPTVSGAELVAIEVTIENPLGR